MRLKLIVDPQGAHVVFLVLEEQDHLPRIVGGHDGQCGPKSGLLSIGEGGLLPPLVVTAIQGECSVGLLAEQSKHEAILPLECGQIRSRAAGGSEGA